MTVGIVLAKEKKIRWQKLYSAISLETTPEVPGHFRLRRPMLFPTGSPNLGGCYLEVRILQIMLCKNPVIWP